MLSRRFLFKYFVLKRTITRIRPSANLVFCNAQTGIRHFASGIFAETTPSKASSREPLFKRRVKKSQKLADLIHFNSKDELMVEDEKPPAARAVVGILEKMDQTDRFLSPEECAKLRSAVITYKFPDEVAMSEKFTLSADSNILQAFNSQERLISGLSYAKFLANENLLNPGCVEPVSALIRASFLRNTVAEGGKRENELIDYLASKLEEKVNNDFPKALHAHLTPSVTAALACSSQWPRALESLKRRISDDRFREYGSVITPLMIKSFEGGKPEVGFELMKMAPALQPMTDDRIHHALWSYLNSIVDKSGNKALDVLNSFIAIGQQSRSFGLYIPRSVSGSVSLFFTRLKTPSFTIRETKISSDECASCGWKLDKIALSADEFSILRSEIVDRFVKNINVYQWSNPAELSRFERVLKELGPLDVIVDGLNIVHSDIRLIGRGRLQKLVDVLTSLNETTKAPMKRPLVLLRPYVTLDRFPSLAEQIRRLASIFVCGHDTADDSFLLYGALVSGPQCYFVTNDLLRSQNERLSHKASALFQAWRRIRQIHFCWNAQGRAWAVRPTDYAIQPQVTNGCYHFPLETDCDEVGTKFNWKAHETAMKWLCIQAKGQTSVQ